MGLASGGRILASHTAHTSGTAVDVIASPRSTFVRKFYIADRLASQGNHVDETCTNQAVRFLRIVDPANQVDQQMLRMALDIGSLL